MKPGRVVLSLCVLVALSFLPRVALAGPVEEDHNCLGPWVGLGRNTGFDTSWTIELHLNSAPDGGRCGTVEYTNPDCGGTLEECTVVNGEIRTVERYTHTGRCAPNARVNIRCEGNTMHYAWIGWERVDSTLHRPAGWQAGQAPSGSGPTGTSGGGAEPGDPSGGGPSGGGPSGGPSGTAPRSDGPGPGVEPRLIPPGGGASGCGCRAARGTDDRFGIVGAIVAVVLLRWRRRRIDTRAGGRDRAGAREPAACAAG
ncbi:MAG: hypothetical protein AB7S26_29190 [Sandaracinaceae bacterium]